MPTFRVWHAAAGTRDGLTWDTAYARLQDAFAVGAAGDTFLVHNAHVGDLTGLTTVTSPGIPSNPVYIYCVDKDAADALSTGAREVLTAGWALWGCHYCYGVRFDSGTGITAANLNLRAAANDFMVFEKCEFRLDSTATANYLGLGNASGYIKFIECTFRFKHAAQAFRSYGIAVFDRCVFSAADSGVLPSTGMFASFGTGEVAMSGIDFSAFPSGMSFSSAAYGPINVAGCKMPTGWTAPVGTFGGPGGSITTTNCWSDSENFHHGVLLYTGLTTTDSTVYLTGGASDGVTPYSWKVVTSATCTLANKHDTPEILFWNGTAGTAQTVTVAVACDKAVALTNADAYLVAEYLDTSTSTQSVFLSDAPGATTTYPFGNPQATSAAQTTDAVSTWTGTGGWTNAKRQSLSVTITPQMIGWHRLRIRSETPSLTFYVNPTATIT